MNPISVVGYIWKSEYVEMFFRNHLFASEFCLDVNETLISKVQEWEKDLAKKDIQIKLSKCPNELVTKPYFTKQEKILFQMLT